MEAKELKTCRLFKKAIEGALYLGADFNFPILVERPEDSAEVAQHLATACVSTNVIGP